MRCIKISLALTLAMGTALFAADSLEDAFKNGKFSGEFRSIYVKGTTTDVPAAFPTSGNNAGSVAVEMNYVTDAYKGFKLGLGFEAAHDLNIHDDGGTLFAR